MKHFISLLIFPFLLCGYAMAYDFSAVCSTGQTLYYNITSNEEPYTVEVVRENESAPFYSTYPTGELVIPESVEYNSVTYSVARIGEIAFKGCIGLTEITIPNSVTSIGHGAFAFCSGLTEFTIPESVREIGVGIFNECSSLTTVNFNATNCTSMSGSVCEGCAFTTLNIGENVTNIPLGAFLGCSGLETIVVESRNTTYDSRDDCNAIIETATNTLFVGCNSTIIPNSVTGIGDSAFSGCNGLTSVTIPNSVISIDIGAFEYCNGLTSVTIGNGVTNIGSGAFYSCSGLTTVNFNATNCTSMDSPFVDSYAFTTLNIGENVTNIPAYAFSNCSGLTEITIPDSVTSIGSDAFNGCSGLTSLTIGNSVEIIGEYAFSNCESISVIYVSANTPPNLDTEVFEATTYSTATLNVPCGAKEAYENANEWSNFQNIRQSCVHNGHGYVDLGLPSGTMWATMNVGASSPEEAGDYYAWGETTTKDTYNWENNIYNNGEYQTLTKYCSISSCGNNGFTDSLTTLEASDDAATANWGSAWRMPTKEEIEELNSNCTVTWTTQNGASGRLFTSLINGNSIFLPVAGRRDDNSLYLADSYGYYWSSSLSTEDPTNACFLGFDLDDYNVNYGSRRRGQSVRPVYKEGNTASNDGIIYQCDFEDDAENTNWTLANGDQTNKWSIGTAANNGGNNGLYISNDGGTTNEYTSTSTSYVYAYRTIEVTDSAIYEVSFDWIGYGENNYDLLYAFIIPTSLNPTLTAGNANGMTGSTNTIPSGWIDIANINEQLNYATTWQHSEKKMAIDAGTYHLVFFWKNNNSSGNNPPAVVDNISIIKETPATMPYTCDFEDEDENAQWTFSNLRNKWYIGSAANNGGNNGLYISNDGGVTNAYTVTSTSYVYAYRTLELTESAIYGVNFDWIANGQSDYDLLRAFMIPVSLNPSLVAGDANGMTDYRNDTPSDWIDITNPAGKLNLASSWQHSEKDIPIEAGTYYLVFFWKNNNSSGDQPPAALDNISIEKSSCMPVTDIRVENITAESVTINWTEPGSAGSWEVIVSETELDETELANYAEVETVSETPTYTATDLNLSTTYYMYIRSVCDVNDENEWTSYTYTTLQHTPATLPYTCDFEDDAENANWIFPNSDQTNTWYIGTAANNGGSNGLYISNDDGESNEYDPGSWSYSYAYREIYINQTGKYLFSFDWKSKGYINYDFLKALVIPANIIPDLTSENIYDYNNTPEGWIDISNSGIMSNRTSWQYYSKLIDIDTTGTYYLVFFWRNDSGSDNNPPAAIDNIEVKLANTPIVITNISTPVDASSVRLKGSITYGGTAEVTERGFLFGSSEDNLDQTLQSSVVGDVFTYTITGLTTGETYYYKAYATNSEGTGYGSVKSFTAVDPDSYEIIYSCDFEDDAENANWHADTRVYPLNEEEDIPHWTIGNLANNGGENGLYIYDDAAGELFSFGSNISYAYREIEIPLSGEFWFSFDWQAMGDGGIGDVLRAFIVPAELNPYMTTTVEDEDVNRINGDSNTTPEGWIDISERGCGMSMVESWQKSTKKLEVEAGSYYLVFYWTSDATSGFQPSGEVDNILIKTALKPYIQLSSATNIEGKSATLNGTILDEGVSEITEAGFLYGTDSTNLNVNLPLADIDNEMVYLLEGLTLNTKYFYQAYATNSKGTAYSEIKSFRTLEHTYEAFYLCDFEDATENANWTLGSDGQTNRWYIGTATSNGGNSSLYISNDEGINYSYNNNSESYSYAYREINLYQTSYQFDFDWKANGESFLDFMKAFVVPASIDPNLSGELYYNPDVWIVISSDEYMNDQEEWQHITKTVNINETGTYYLVFYWKNDSSRGEQPPAAVDNIEIKQPSEPNVITNIPTIVSSTSAILKANITFSGTAEVTERGFLFGSSEDNLDQTLQSSDLTDEFTYTLTGLTSGETYYYKAYATNSKGTGYGIVKSFTVVDPDSYDIIYSCDFENEEENANWIADSDASTYWIINNFVNNGGEKSLYIVCDDSIINEGCGGAYSYAYREIDMPFSGEYWFNFDWRALGEDDIDFLRAFLVPVEINPNLNTSDYDENYIYYDNAPEGWIDISEYGNGMSEAETWRRSRKKLGVEAGAYYLVFFWTSDPTESYGLSGAVDNIVIRNALRPCVTTASPTNIGTTSATLNGNLMDGGVTEVTERGFVYGNDIDNLDESVQYSGSNDNITCNLTGLTPGKLYYYKAYATNSNGTDYGNIEIFQLPTAQFAEHNYVDLGLPSLIMWATANVGSTTPDGSGDYFAWGETSQKDGYYYTDNYYYSYSDNPDTLPASADVASVNWNEEWRMPTKEDLQELVDNCDATWIDVDGLRGMQFTASNGNSIFLPAVGHHGEYSYIYDYGKGYYMSSSIGENTSNFSDIFISSAGSSISESERYHGYSVRAIFKAVTTVATNSVTEITPTSAILNGSILFPGSAEITDRGFLFGTDSTDFAQNYTSPDNTDDFSYTLSDLTANTTYYFKAYATINGETLYGDVSTFRTFGPPEVTFYYPTWRDTIAVGLKVKIETEAELLSRKIYMGTSRNSLSEIADEIIYSDTDSAFVTSAGNLSPRTLYYAMAEATNEYGTTRSDTLSFYTYGSFVDSRDNTTYYTIQIGEQTWMAENLKYAGPEISLGVNSIWESEPSYFYPNDDEANVATYGYLYNWSAAMNGEESSDRNPSGVQGICPNGWHLPSSSEWAQLTDYLGGIGDGLAICAKLAGNADLWNSGVWTDYACFGESGFAALPAGTANTIIGQQIAEIYINENAFFIETKGESVVWILNRGGFALDANIPFYEDYMLDITSIRCLKGTTIYAYDTVNYCGDEYTFGTQTLTASGDYEETFTLGTDKDSIVYLHLTMNPAPTASISASTIHCSGQTATLTNTASGGTAPYTYNWTADAGITLGETTVTTTETSYNNTATPTFSECNKSFSVSLSVTDANGCTATATPVTINVERDDFDLPDDVDITVHCIAEATEPTSLPTVTDNCGNTLTPSAAVQGGTYNGCSGTRTYTFTYTDCAGHSHDWTYIYTIAPEDFLTLMPPNEGTTVACISEAIEPPTPTVTDNCGNTLTPSDTVQGGTYDGCEGTRTYTFTYTDCSGHSHDWTYTYTIENNTAPELIDTWPSNITGQNACYANRDISGLISDSDVENIYTANCGTISVSHSDVADPTANCGWTVTRTYTITDGCNQTTKTQSVSGSDQTAPTIGDAGFNRELTSTNCTFIVPNLTEEVRAISSDNCTANAELTIEQSPVAGTEITEEIVVTVTITVTDQCGLSSTKDVTLTIPEELTTSLTAGTISCNGGTTNITNTVVGGATPYTYYWTDDTHNQNNEGVGAGNYTVTVTDNNGCSATSSIAVSQPDALTTSLSATEINCHGQTSDITNTVAGGTSPYTYHWSNDADTQDLEGVGGGTYSVTVTDSNNCTATASVTVTEPAELTSELTAGSVACSGGTADITNTVSGGTSPLTYLWSNGNNTQNLTGVVAGEYSVTVTDAKGCSVVRTAEITQPDVLTVTLNAGTIACNGQTAIVSTEVAGGTQPYAYAWNNGAETENLTNVGEGTYSVTVTDANGCATSSAITITQPDELTVSISGPTSVCENTTTTLTANAQGGTTDYTYLWNTTATTSSITTPAITTETSYSVTVTDANGCSVTESVSVAIGDTPGISIADVTLICLGGDILLQANVSNAGTDYTIEWTASPTSGAGLPDNLTTDAITVTPTESGAYTYIVSLTATSCSDGQPFNSSENVTLTVNPLPEVEITNNTNETVLTCSTETISLTATGGTTYQWSNGTSTANASITAPETYIVTVTDDNGCSSTANYTITQDIEAPTVTITNTTGTELLTCTTTAINVLADGTGTSYLWSNDATTAENTFTEGGTYTVTATADNGCTSTANIQITPNSDAPALSITNNTGETILTCSLTSIIVTAEGSGASYEWSNGATTAETTLTEAGTYTVTTTATNGCTASAQIAITADLDAPVIYAYAVDSSICQGGSTTISANGGQSYTWLPETGLPTTVGASLTATPTETTTYTVTGIGENGCTGTAEVTITVNQPTSSEMSLTCCNQYWWEGNEYTETGEYTHTYTAANGCDSVVTLHLTINNSVTNEISETACESYEWYGQTYTETGDYEYTLTAVNGCDSVVTLHLTINQPTESNDTAISCGSYEWNGSTYTESGNYQFTMPEANANGCDSVANLHLTINQPTEGNDTVTVCNSYEWYGQTYTETGDYVHTLQSVNGCDSVVNLHLTINNSTTGEFADQMCSGVPYEYEGQTFTEAGTYHVTLVSANGCDSIVTLMLTYSNSCGGIISGVITDAGTDEAIPNARVTVGNQVTRTDNNGEYSLEVVRGPMLLRVSANGYASYYEAIDIQSDTMRNIALYKPEISMNVDSIAVTSYPYLAQYDSITITNTGNTALVWSSVSDYGGLALLPYDEETHRRRNSRALWDSIQTFSTQFNAEQAIATDGFFIYTSSWQRPGEFNRYTPDGEYIETFYIENVGMIRNLSFDGTYFYGTEATNIIFKLDLDNQTLVDSITTDISNIRHCSFDRQNGNLLAGDWNSLYSIDTANGTSTPIRGDLMNVYSSAYDNLSPGGPYLWLFSQASQNNGPSAYIRQFSIGNADYTDKTHYLDDIGLGNASLAGGICASEYVCEGKFVLLADIQNPSGNNIIATYEIGRTNNIVSPEKKSGRIMPNESLSIGVREHAVGEGEFEAKIRYRAAVMGNRTKDVNVTVTAVAPECD
ncbi:MAG: leucine-rich repeat protein, partial [Bacteroidales bacterium]|nr:leucine-rich repeat protein [Bacteroidales bacterium]